MWPKSAKVFSEGLGAEKKRMEARVSGFPDRYSLHQIATPG
jgi:hypothetical protein